MTERREARLRPEFAALYPAIAPGVWLPASDVGRQLLLWHLAINRPPGEERLMSEEHFEFRGGEPRHGPWTNQRSGGVPH